MLLSENSFSHFYVLTLMGQGSNCHAVVCMHAVKLNNEYSHADGVAVVIGWFCSTCQSCMNVRDVDGKSVLDRLIAKMPDAAMVTHCFLFIFHHLVFGSGTDLISLLILFLLLLLLLFCVLVG